MTEALRDRITKVFHDVYRSHAESSTALELTDDTVLLASGLDSLGLALAVVMLEQELGYDPFVASQEAYYPRTFGEFVRFYETNSPQ